MNSIDNRLSVSKSVFIDILRIVAAFVVFFSHLQNDWFPETVHSSETADSYAHTAVIIFFVLSGFVISYTSSIKVTGLKDYLIARIARLISIVYPALLLSALVLIYIYYQSPEVYKEYTRGNDMIRFILTSGFVNEIWLFSSAPPVNRPLWSISFEFWYYVIFGLWFFRSQYKYSWVIIAVACLIAGPKILAMMPIWILGCFAYKFNAPKLNAAALILIYIGCLFLIYVAMYVLPPFPWGLGTYPFYFANQFVTDYILGFGIAVMLWLYPEGLIQKIGEGFVKKLRLVADLTFPLYVFHLPLIALFKSLYAIEIHNTIQMLTCSVLIIIIVSVLGIYLQNKRFFWNGLLIRLFNEKKNSGI